jgi:hypothetical protein
MHGALVVRHPCTMPFRETQPPIDSYPKRVLTFQMRSSQQKNSISVGKRCPKFCQGKSAHVIIFFVIEKNMPLHFGVIRRVLFASAVSSASSPEIFVSLGCRSLDGGWRIVIKNGRQNSFIRFARSTGANASRYNFLSPTGVFIPADLRGKLHADLAIHET